MDLKCPRSSDLDLDYVVVRLSSLSVPLAGVQTDRVTKERKDVGGNSTVNLCGNEASLGKKWWIGT